MRPQQESRAAQLLVAALSVLALAAIAYSFDRQWRLWNSVDFLRAPPTLSRFVALSDISIFMLAAALNFGAVVAVGRRAHLSVANAVAAVGWAVAGSGLLVLALLLTRNVIVGFQPTVAAFMIYAFFFPHLPFSALILPIAIRYSRGTDRAAAVVGMACPIAVALAAFSTVLLKMNFS